MNSVIYNLMHLKHPLLCTSHLPVTMSNVSRLGNAISLVTPGPPLGGSVEGRFSVTKSAFMGSTHHGKFGIWGMTRPTTISGDNVCLSGCSRMPNSVAPTPNMG